MVSERKLAPNRRNALKSTGPRTEEGKRNSSMNALKHGLCSTRLELGEDRGDFEQLRGELLTELTPVGEDEQRLAEQIIETAWKVRQARILDDQLTFRLCDSSRTPTYRGIWQVQESTDTLVRLARYRDEHASGMRSMYRKLRRLQSVRQSLRRPGAGRDIKIPERTQKASQLPVATEPVAF